VLGRAGHQGALLGATFKQFSKGVRPGMAEASRASAQPTASGSTRMPLQRLIGACPSARVFKSPMSAQAAPWWCASTTGPLCGGPGHRSLESRSARSAGTERLVLHRVQPCPSKAPGSHGLSRDRPVSRSPVARSVRHSGGSFAPPCDTRASTRADGSPLPPRTRSGARLAP
jgi:hypothetical protein